MEEEEGFYVYILVIYDDGDVVAQAAFNERSDGQVLEGMFLSSSAYVFV